MKIKQENHNLPNTCVKCKQGFIGYIGQVTCKNCAATFRRRAPITESDLSGDFTETTTSERIETNSDFDPDRVRAYVTGYPSTGLLDRAITKQIDSVKQPEEVKPNKYRVLLDRKTIGQKNGTGYITAEGAKLIWAAYAKINPSVSQTMERREERGGICWLSEIRLFKERGFLPENFNWTDYELKDDPRREV